MSEWKEYKLGDICEIKGGKRLPLGHELVIEKTKHPYIKARDIKNGKIATDNLEFVTENTHNLISRYIVRKNDVCITIVANIGDVGIVPLELDYANLTENAIRLTSFSKVVNSAYLSYLLSTDTYKKYCEGLAAGAAQAKLGIYKIKTINIKLPEISTQHRIASILSTYDDLIENNNRRIVLLEQMAEQIYKEWFVRMRFPGYENTEFEKGVPKGWANIYFRDFIKLNRGFDLPEDKIIEGIYPIVASTSIKAYHNQYKVEAPCIVTGRSGSLGTVQYVNKKAWPLNTSLYVKDFKGNSPQFVFYFLKSIKLENFNCGAGVPTLNQNHLHTLRLFCPSNEIQRKFDDLIIPIFNEVENLQLQTQTLKQTRDLLLPRLISGKLKVNELIEFELV